jgi:L-ribulose-5-phosphate 4-epimerase
MVIVDFDGRVVEGTLNPSSDTPTHRRLFLGFPGIRSVVHTHSRKAVAFAQAARGIPLLGTTHADYFANAIPFTRKLTRKEIKGEGYQWAIGDSIVESLQGRDPLALRGTLVNGHAPFTWGQTAADAAEVAVALEWIAHLAILSLQLAPRLAPIDPTLSSRHFLRKHGPTAHYGQHDLA